MENLQEPNVDEFLINISSSIMNKRDSSDGVKNQQEFIEDVKSECSKLNRIEIEKTKVMGSILMIKFKRVRTYFYFCYECQEYFGMKKNGNNKSTYHTLSHHKRFEELNESDSSKYLELSIEVLVSVLLYSAKSIECIITPPLLGVELDIHFKDHQKQKTENLLNILFPLCQKANEDHRLEVSLNGFIFPTECESLTLEILNKTQDSICIFNVLYYSEELQKISMLYPDNGCHLFTYIENGKSQTFPKGEVWAPTIEDENKDFITDFLVIYYTFTRNCGTFHMRPSVFLTKVFPIFIYK